MSGTAQRTRISLFRSPVAKKLEFTPIQKVNGHWSLTNDALRYACLVNCELARRVVTLRISADSLTLLQTYQ